MKVQRLHYHFPNQPQTAVLENVHFNVQPGEFVAIVGPSGSGKTTLLRLLAGLLFPTRGNISINQKKPGELKGKIGLVFQHYAAFPWLSVEQNIAFGLDIRKTMLGIRNQKIERLLSITSLHDHKNRWPEELSGGQKQRVALARTLALEPNLLLLDEPFGALDAITRQQIQQSLQELFREFEPTTVLVTHEIEEALFLADRIMVLQRKPARITAGIQNPFPKPRKPEIRNTVEFQKTRNEIFKLLKETD